VKWVLVYLSFDVLFFFAEKPKVRKQNKSSKTFFGMLLSALNFFPIPYYVFLV
jgi:hypothetical protein